MLKPRALVRTMTMPPEDESAHHPLRVALRALPLQLAPTVAAPPEVAAAAGTPHTAEEAIIPGRAARVRMRKPRSEGSDAEAKMRTAETETETAQMTRTKSGPANDAAVEATDATTLQLAATLTELAQLLHLAARTATDTTPTTMTDAMIVQETAATQDAVADTMMTIVVLLQDAVVAMVARLSRSDPDAPLVPKSMITRSVPSSAVNSLLDWANEISESSSRII